MPIPITMSPIENCWFGTPGAVITSPRNGSLSSLSRGWCFTVRSIGTCTSRPLRSFTSSLVGMPAVQRDHEHVQPYSDRDDVHPTHAPVQEAEGEDEDVGRQQDREAEVVDPCLREVDQLERNLDDQSDEQQPERVQVDAADPLEAPLGDDHDQYGHDDRRHEEHHGDTVPIRVLRTGANVYDVRTPVSGTVVRVVVDEGQMIAEEDPVAAIDDDGVETVVVTQVPGVVRELYIEGGRPVSAGDVIARIDES